MSTVARQVLNDCRLALEFLEQSTTDDIWRVHWVAAIALVRTVGDVLYKVDYISGDAASVSNEQFDLWKKKREEHKIYWDFIRSERNNVLHEYRTAAYPDEKIPIAVEFTLGRVEDGEIRHERQVIELEENTYRPMLEGPWEGNDARDVLQEAIDWWEEQLNTIDDRIAARSTAS